MAKESLLDRLRNKTTDVLDEEGKLRKELLELKIKHSSGQLKETHKIREIRRSIAQLKTLNKEQELQEKSDKIMEQLEIDFKDYDLSNAESNENSKVDMSATTKRSKK